MSDYWPIGFRDYRRKFYVKRAGLRWIVFSIDAFEQIERHIAGPFWRQRTALKICLALTQHYRDGWDMGYRKEAVYGGARIA